MCVCVYRSMQHPCMSSWTLTLPELWMKAIGLSTECLSASSQGAPISLSAHSLVLCYLSLVTSSPSPVPWLASPLSLASSTTCTSRSLFSSYKTQYTPIPSFLPKQHFKVSHYVQLPSSTIVQLIFLIAGINQLQSDERTCHGSRWPCL